MSDYGGEHQALRRALAPYVPGGPCCRCGRPIAPGQPWDLDHDDDRVNYRGPAHAYCNRSAGARLGNARRGARRRRLHAMEIALGLEIAEDRRHTSIAAAGHLDGEFVMVELVAYLIGTDATAEVARLRTERIVVAVAVDPRSPGATLIKPLTDAAVEVATPSTSDLAVAHGEFLDAAAAGRLRHAGQPELDAAVRHGTQRPLAGAQVWNRRGSAVDVSPLTAATLALWALLHAPRPQPFFARWEAH